MSEANMDLVIYNVSVTSVTASVFKDPYPLKVTSRSSHHHTVDISALQNRTICFTIAHGGTSAATKLDIPIRVGRKTRKRGWGRLRVSSNQTAIKAFRIHRETSSGPKSTIVIYETPNTADFLGDINDQTPLGDIALPGTHESCSLYGFPISQCQQPSTPIERQLLDGVRFLDVRLRVVGDQLLMYHGPRPQRSNLTTLLKTLQTFLQNHPTECLILCIKEESSTLHSQFSQMVYKAFQPFLDHWFLEERIPLLGEVRGKGILMSRFNRSDEGEGDEKNGSWEEGMGIHPTRWPDSRKEGFEWDCAGTMVRIQDWYRVTSFLSIPEKLEAIVNHLSPTLARTSSKTDISDTPTKSDEIVKSPHSNITIKQPISSTQTKPSLTSPSTSSSTSLGPTPTPFTLSFTSAAYFPLSPPTIIAKGFGWPHWGLGVEGVNSRLYGWLLRCLAGDFAEENRPMRICGCVAMDFYRQVGARSGMKSGNELAELLVLMNQRDGSE